MLWILVLLPAVCGLGCVLVGPAALRRGLLVLTGVAHLVATVSLWQGTPGGENTAETAWLALDSLAFLFILITDILFIAAAVYTFSYLDEHPAPAGRGRGFLAQETLFPSLLLLFLAAMSLGILSQHCIVTWVAVEATTLVTASLICYHRSARSLEAAWKYMLICSVGIALALAGNMALAVALSFGVSGGELTYANIMQNAQALQPLWLKIGFVLLLVGYGTKIGLFPMHTWLPDAHSEAPAPVSALLSGTLLNCALIAMLRIFAIMNRAGMGEFAGRMLGVFGLLSIAVAAVFIVRQHDFKRLLAYSSIEHMGIITLGMSYSALSREAATFHVLNHSLAKGLLFLTAGNILSVYGSKSIAKVRGVLNAYPQLGVLWIIGLLAICGLPPFGIFVSELWLIMSLADGGRWITAALVLVLLGIVFIGMSRSFIRMVSGEKPETVSLTPGSLPVAFAPQPLPWQRILPGWLLAGGSLYLGICVSGTLRALIRDAARIVGGQ